jgi:hypothetical protein
MKILLPCRNTTAIFNHNHRCNHGYRIMKIDKKDHYQLSLLKITICHRIIVLSKSKTISKNPFLSSTHLVYRHGHTKAKRTDNLDQCLNSQTFKVLFPMIMITLTLAAIVISIYALISSQITTKTTAMIITTTTTTTTTTTSKICLYYLN